MDVVWIAMGVGALCMPHVSAAPLGGNNAWSGLPYPAEALVVCLALLAASRMEVSRETRGRLPQAALWAVVAEILFECVCALALPGVCGDLALSFVGEMVHSGAVSLWLVATALDVSEPKDPGKAPVAVQALLFASGFAWYVATAWVRSGHGLWDPTLEAAEWLAALLWALPVACLLSACSLGPRAFARLAAGPFLGVLLGNRAWLVAVQAIGAAPRGIAWQVMFAAPALALAAFFCAALMGAGEAAGEEAAGEAPAERSCAEEAGGPAPIETAIPLHAVPGAEKLSEREREVVLLALSGCGTPEIAGRCGVATSTARTYLQRAFDKLGVASAAELAAAMKGALGDARAAAPSVPAKAKAGTLLSPSLFGVAVLCACALGLVVVAVALGMRVPLVLRIALAAAFGAAAVWMLLKARGLDAGCVPVAAAAGVCVVACLVPPGIRSQLLLHGWGSYIVALGMTALAFVLLRRATLDRLAAIAAVALVGDERVLAYLEGRGLKDMVASVALLTARDYPQGGIAKTLSLSRSTVTHYRRRAYETLGVSNKGELIKLLEDEAGLAV